MSRGVIHYTNHVCVVATGKTIYVQARERGTAIDVTADMTRYQNEYPSSPPPYGYAVCNERRLVRHTVDREQVTCKHCLKVLAWSTLERFEENRKRNPIGSWRNWASHDERTERSWATCCKGHGHAYPFTGDRLVEFQRQQLAKLVDRGIDVGSMITRIPGALLKAIRGSWEFVPDELREVLRPALDETAMAVDLLEEVARMLQRARANVANVASRIANGGIDVDAERVLVHIAEARSHPRAWPELVSLPFGLAESEAA